MRVFLAAVLCGYVLLLAVMVLLGFAVIDLVLPVGGLADADQDAVEWLADGRNASREDLSWVGSTLAGGVVIPVVIGTCLLVFALLRRWRLAAFVLFAVALESGVYRVTADIVNRERPDVKRLESLPVDASYPSGHTAASIALYGGLLLLLASKINRMSVMTRYSSSGSQFRCSSHGPGCTAGCTTPRTPRLGSFWESALSPFSCSRRVPRGRRPSVVTTGAVSSRRSSSA